MTTPITIPIDENVIRLVCAVAVKSNAVSFHGNGGGHFVLEFGEDMAPYAKRLVDFTQCNLDVVIRRVP